MAQRAVLYRDKTMVLTMDFQQRRVNNVAIDAQVVVGNASHALKGARQSRIPVIYGVHRRRDFQEYALDIEIHQ